MRVYETRRDIWIHLLLYPGHTLPTALAPILVGIGLAVHDGVFAWWPAFAAFLASWLVHCGGVFVDQYLLLARHPALGEHPELDHAVARGALRLPFLRAVTLGWYAAAFVPGVYLVRVIGPGAAVVLGAIGIVAATWYGAGKPSMAELGLADPVFFAMFGVVAVPATYYVQAVAHHAANPLPLPAFLVGLPTAALVTNVLVIDDLRDAGFDIVKGWKTTAVRFGPGTSRREHLVLTAAAYVAPLVLAAFYGPWLLLPLATLPVAVLAERAVQRARGREPLIPWTPRSAFLAMAYAALVGLGLGLAR